MIRMSDGKASALDAVCRGLFLSLRLLFVRHYSGSESDSVSKEGSESVQNVVIALKVERPGKEKTRPVGTTATRTRGRVIQDAIDWVTKTGI